MIFARQSDAAISNTEHYPITLEQKYSYHNFTFTFQLAVLATEKSEIIHQESSVKGHNNNVEGHVVQQVFANVELYLQARYYLLRSFYSRVCSNTLRLCRNCTLQDLTSLSPQTACTTKNTVLSPSLQSKRVSLRRRREGTHYVLPCHCRERCSAHAPRLRSRHEAHRLRSKLKSECLLKACSDNPTEPGIHGQKGGNTLDDPMGGHPFLAQESDPSTTFAMQGK